MGKQQLQSKLAYYGAGLSVVLALQACGGPLEAQDWYAYGNEHSGAASGASENQPSSTAATQGAVSPACIRDAELLESYDYVSEDAFWLGSQDDDVRTVSGLGYFVSVDNKEGEPQYRFGRKLSWSVGPDGTLRDEREYPVLGEPDAESPDCPRRLKAPLAIQPRATSIIRVGANLDSASAPIDAPFDVQNPSATSNYSTSFYVYDGRGALRTLELYFRAIGNNEFEYHTLGDGSDLAGGTPGVFQELSAGRLAFDYSGRLKEHIVASTVVDFAGGALPGQVVQYEFGKSIAEGGSGLNLMTSFSSGSWVFELKIDGYRPGTATHASIVADGTLTVHFSNAQSVVIGRVLMARFADEHALWPVKDGSLRESSESGAPLFGLAMTSSFGSVR